MSECPICYEDVTDSTGSVKLSCAHTFHLSCITSWFSKQEHGSCPCCRKQMGEKEDTARIAEDDTLSYVSDETDASEEDGTLISSILLSRAQLVSLLNKLDPLFQRDEVVADHEWSSMVNSSFYRTELVNGIVHIRFSNSELRSYIISKTWSDLPVNEWHALVREHIETVTLTHTQFKAVQASISSPPYLSKYIWNAMVKSDLYIKGDTTFAGEIPICFTYATLSSAIINSSDDDLTWRKWKELVKMESIPLTGAFISASIDFSIPLSLPKPPRKIHITRTMPLKTIIDNIDNHTIHIHPSQSYWSVSIAKEFIQAIMTGRSIPPVIIDTTHSIPHILDGKQRILTASQFRKDMFTDIDEKLFSSLSESEQYWFDTYMITTECV